MSVEVKGGVQFSGIDAISYFYHTKTGLAKLTGVGYWLSGRKVTVSESGLKPFIWRNRDALFVQSLVQARKVSGTTASVFLQDLPRQQFTNSCGAQSLRQAAAELGVENISNKNGCDKFDGLQITDKCAEEAIFGAMNNLQNNSGKKFNTGLNRAGYSTVDNILKTVRMLGLDGRIYSSIGNWVNMHLIKPEAQTWRKINGLSPIRCKSVPVMRDNERLIVHCQRGSRGHYIMQRPDGSCYDPATGKQYASRGEFKCATDWKLSGWSVLVCNRDK